MSNFIKTSIQIGEDGNIEDTYDKWGFIYIESDHRIAAPEKERETTSYAEEQGEHTDPRTVDAPFDYTVKFLIETPNTLLENANVKINAFNNAIRDVDEETKIKTCKTITFYNSFKGVAITGIPEVISEALEFYRRQDGRTLDCVIFELKIHVSDPSLCTF